MPLHLPAFTRRRFLIHTAAGGVALLTSRSLRGAEGAAEEHWALLSDTHIAADPALVELGVNMSDHLRETVVEVAARHPAPAGVLVNGDCAFHTGQAEDYRQFVSLLAPLREAGLPVHCTVGNHDSREEFWSALPEEARAPKPVANRQISVLETPLANWILLDSLDLTNHTPGRLGDEQLQWLRTALDARPDKPALVMVHHHPMLHPDRVKTAGITETGPLLEILRPRRQVKALFYGHTHTWRTEEQDGLHFINLPAVSYSFNPDPKAEVTGWVSCALNREGMKLEVRARDTTHAEHGQVKEFAWRA